MTTVPTKATDAMVNAMLQEWTARPQQSAELYRTYLRRGLNAALAAAEAAPADGVRVRVAVAMNAAGQWDAVGSSTMTDERMVREVRSLADEVSTVTFLTALVQPPAEIAATVEEVPT